MDGSPAPEHGFCESDARRHQWKEREGLLYVDIAGVRSFLELADAVLYLGGSETGCTNSLLLSPIRATGQSR